MVDDFVKRGSESKEEVRATLRCPDMALVSRVVSWVEEMSFCAMRFRREDKSRASMWWLEFVITSLNWMTLFCVDLDEMVDVVWVRCCDMM
jgi:acetolactate synthase regulatory subunit